MLDAMRAMDRLCSCRYARTPNMITTHLLLREGGHKVCSVKARQLTARQLQQCATTKCLSTTGNLLYEKGPHGSQVLSGQGLPEELPRLLLRTSTHRASVQSLLWLEELLLYMISRPDLRLCRHSSPRPKAQWNAKQHSPFGFGTKTSNGY